MSSKARVPEALRLLEQAITRDPHYGPALAWARSAAFGLFSTIAAKTRRRTASRASISRRALEVAGDDPGILANAVALGYFGADIGAMMALVDRALALNPNFARGWHDSSFLRRCAGQLDIAIEHGEAALRLSPRARVGPSLGVIGSAHFLSRQFDEAVPKLLLAIQEDPRARSC
jgi:adenylate cyclase